MANEKRNMTFKEMTFKGKRVFVEIDGDGRLRTENGRAYMKYNEADDKIYRPNPQNLSDEAGVPVIASPALTTSVGAAKKNLQKSKPKTHSEAVKPKKSQPQGKVVVAYTDGACIGNPGPSGLGYTIQFPDGRQVARGEPLGRGTNNIAELTAIKRVLEHIDDPSCPVVIHTDSEYSIGVLVKGWKAKANQELIFSIRKLLSRYSSVELRKVRGHAGIPENEHVDDLARTAAETQSRIEE